MNSKELLKIILDQMDPDDLKELLQEKFHPDNTKSLDDFSKEIRELFTATRSKKYLKSIETSIIHLNGHFGKDKQLSEITQAEAQRFMIELSRKVPKGWKVYYRNYKALLNKALELGYILSNPFLRVNLPRVQVNPEIYLTPEQIDLICQNIKNPMIKILVKAAFYTGARLAEITFLRWGNVNFNNSSITIGDENFTTKSRKTRTIPLCRPLEVCLKSIMPKVVKKEAFVFSKPGGFCYTPEYISKSFKKEVIKSGLDPRIHFHTIRHSTASFLIKKGVSIYDLKNWLGHASVTTTEIYSHSNFNNLKSAAEHFAAA